MEGSGLREGEGVGVELWIRGRKGRVGGSGILEVRLCRVWKEGNGFRVSASACGVEGVRRMQVWGGRIMIQGGSIRVLGSGVGNVRGLRRREQGVGHRD